MPDNKSQTTEQSWTHLVHVEINSLLNRADFAKRHGRPQAAAALEWCARAALTHVKEIPHAE